ncbi:efflux RND transporter periplasmic adaptor subunit [Arhodomonas aquaeolei]|uniref:efflux RND transporter periplasmic adaptor subunit n=1 Tax=Arhodomonas aquaeolei TaxID=2369 RepID=UPI0021674B1C|nr:efflux RND transporter periplasmic adaptor subunit [Arhodomonas aquaeolei]MCS4504190.1 efflux RND transporter periplasmic adaptor subunit [Arhodomonas aquaeolei]
MKVIIRLFLVVVFLGFVFGGIFGWKYLQMQEMAKQANQPQPPATIATATAREVSWRPGIQSVGSVSPVQGIEITTEVAGKISEVSFESSSRVKDGDVLVQLDDSVDQASLRGLKADRELARVQFERNANLLPKRAVSQSQYDEAKARYEAARAQVAEQEARIAKKVIRAPFDGLLGIKQVDQGEYITAGQSLVTLTALDPIYVDYAVPERRFGDLRNGQTVQIRVSAYPERQFEGEITAIDSGVDEGTRSVNVRATLPNPDDVLRPGMFARVQTLMPEERTVVVVPRTAISYNTYGDFVYVVTGNDGGQRVAKRRAVTTGATQSGSVEITDGLSAGEEVVRAGLVKLRDGQPVTVDNSTALDGEVSGE